MRILFENLGAQLVKSVAVKTNDIAGDGTTTATLLAQALIAEGLRNVAAGANPMELNKGIAAAAEKTLEELKARATEVSDTKEIANVATVSSRDEVVGEIVAAAMEKVGKDGVVTVEESQSIETALEVTEGISFDKGYLSLTSSTTTTLSRLSWTTLQCCLFAIRFLPSQTSSHCWRRLWSPTVLC